MTPTKLLIGQIVVVLAIISLGIWTATQWAAASLAYQPELGLPWFALLGVGLPSAPWTGTSNPSRCWPPPIMRSGLRHRS